MRAPLLIASMVLLAGCDFDGDLSRWRCGRGQCDAGTDGGVDAGHDAGTRDDGGTGDGGSDGGPTDAGQDSGWVFQPDGSYNHVFLTSAVVSPDGLGSAGAADALCNAVAADAGLPGVYAAWTSELGEDTFVRTGMNRARGWLRPDGKPFADTPDDLMRGYLRYPLRLDERGNDYGSMEVLTGVRSTGEVALNCNDFSGLSKMVTGCAGCGGAPWSDNSDAPCSMGLHVVCFGVDQYRALDPAPIGGPKIFIAAPWTPGGGLASADAWCNARAAALDAGTGFVALLAITTASPQSRLVSDGGWWRLDGVEVGDLRALPLSAPIERLEDGGVPSQSDQSDRVFIGTLRLQDPAIAIDNDCNDWFGWDGGQPHEGDTGSALWSDDHWVNNFSVDCGPHPIYCVQP